MDYESTINRLVGVLRETTDTPMTLANHCIVALEKAGKIVKFVSLSSGAMLPGIVYCQWNNHYKASISLKTKEAIYQSFAFALLVVGTDCSGQLIASLSDDNSKQLFYNNSFQIIEQLVKILKQLPLTADNIY